MIRAAYLLCLLVSLGGLGWADYRYRLAWFYDWRRSLACLLPTLLLLLLWDMAGIGMGIFFVGSSPYLTGLRLAPQLPVEELFFLGLLCYVTLLGYRLLSRRIGRA